MKKEELIMTKQNQGIFDVKRKEYHIAIIVLCLAMLMFFFCFTANATDEDTTTEKNEVTTETTTPERAIPEDSGHAEEIETANNNEVVSDENREVDSNGSVAEDENKQVETAPAIVGTWKSESGGWRFYNSAGVMQKGLFTIDGKKYYLGPDGAMKTGWHKVSDAYYYFGSSGAAAKGWQKIGGYWYYFDKMGVMLTGNQVLDGKSYYLGAANDGAMKTGWQVVGATYESNKKIADRWGYYGADGAALKNNWLKYGGYWYYFDADGVMQTDVAEIGGKYYYFGTENDGRMKTGWQKIDDTWAYLGADGAARTGWQKIGNYWYYLGEYGEMETDLRNIDGSLYYLGSDGAMRTGWQQVSGDWYYFNASGAAITRWEQINGVWYYFKSNYKMVKDTILNIDGREFAFHAWGGMIIGSVHVNGKTYYTDEFGAIIAEYVPSTVVDYGLQFLGENGTRFNDWYYRNAKYRTWAWCNTFVSYVMYNCGISFKKTAYVPDAEQWMQNHYDWVSVNEAKSGDIIIFCWTGEGNNSGKGDRDHIGFLISKNKDGSFTTLEGNTSGNKVAIRTRYIKNIRNIFRPRY